MTSKSNLMLQITKMKSDRKWTKFERKNIESKLNSVYWYWFGGL